MFAARAAAVSAAALLALAACAATEPSDPNATLAGAPCTVPAEARSSERIAQVVGIAGDRPARVVDHANLIDDATSQMLSARSAALEAATTDQLIVVTVPTLGGLSIEQFGMALANHWGVGRADANNGVLVLVAPSDRRVRLEVGCGLEALLTNDRAAEIVAEMTRAFHEGDYSGGLNQGTDAIDRVLRTRPERPYVS